MGRCVGRRYADFLSDGNTVFRSRTGLVLAFRGSEGGILRACRSSRPDRHGRCRQNFAPVKKRHLPEDHQRCQETEWPWRCPASRFRHIKSGCRCRWNPAGCSKVRVPACAPCGCLRRKRSGPYRWPTRVRKPRRGGNSPHWGRARQALFRAGARGCC